MNAIQSKEKLDPPAERGPENLGIRQISRSGCREAFVMFLNRGTERPAEMFNRMDHTLIDLGGKVVRMDSIGIFNTLGTAGQEQRYCCDCEGCPLNSAGENGASSCPVTGLYVNLISGTPVEPVWLGGQIVGTVYEDDHARYCQLNEIHADARLSRAQQTRQIYERMDAALATVDMNFSNVVRTWLFMDKILEWYDDFNEARDGFFKERNIYDAMVPASTGVGAANASGSAIVASLTAVVPLDGRVKIRPVASPLQGPALDYGSSFSRAVELAMPDHRRLFVSGTASIAESGETIYVGDIEKQVAFSMEVVEAILKSRGMDWQDVTRAVAYFKHLDDLPVFARYCEQNGLLDLPAAVVSSDVCRDDLLFEIEVDGIKVTG